MAATVFRDPSAFDAGLAELERWAPDPDERRHAREHRLARDLIELSRLDRGVERAENAPVELAKLVGAIAADHPQVVVDGPRSVVLESDSRRLARILFLLLDNALRHGAPPVTLRYGPDAVAVSDLGPGFTSYLLARATEPFVIGDRAHVRGVGLGLAIAERQARLLGGELALANGAGGGAIATLRFAGGARPAGE